MAGVSRQSVSLGMARVHSEPSPYRKQMLRISQLLSKEDVDKIVYLSEDFVTASEVGRVSSGIDLMRCLERHSRSGPGNCSFLFYCLKEVGRDDLAAKLAEFILQPLVQCVPPSFTTSGQMLALKLNKVYSKQMRYAQQMRYMNSLTRTKSHWESNWSEIFQVVTQSLANLHPLPPVSDVAKVFGSTFEQVSGIARNLTSALVHFQTRGEHALASEYLQAVNANYKEFYTILESIQWKKWQHLGVLSEARIASKACSFLSDFLLEVLGKESIIEEVEKFSGTLTTIESLVGIAGNGLNLLQWMFVVAHMTSTHSLDFRTCEAQISSTISLLHEKGVAHRNELLADILRGTEVIDKVQQDGLLAARPDTFGTMISNCPILLSLYISFLVLQYSALVTPGDLQQIHGNFVLQEKIFAKMYSQEVKAVFQQLCNELDGFLEQIVETALKREPTLQELIRGMFDY